MAEINFGLIDTQAPARIANALMPSPEQQGAQALQVMQMQQAARQGQVSQMQLQKMKQDAEGVAEFSRRVASFGGPSDPMEIARAYLAHPDPEMKKFGAGLMQKAQATALYDKRYPVAPPAAATPPVVMPPAATGSPTAGVNTLPALVGATSKPMDENQLLKQIQDEIIDLSPLADDPRAKQRLATLNEREKELLKTLTVAQGTTVFRPGLPPLTVPEATPTDVRTMQQLGYPLTQQGYTAFRDAQRPDRLLTPSEEDQKVRIAAAGRPMGTKVILPPMENAEQKGKGEANVKLYGDISAAARLAAKSLPAIETQGNIINRADFATGFGTDVKKAGASLLAALGVPEAERFATNAQTFLAASQQAVLQRQLEQKGPQTEADAQRITQTGAQLGNTPDANKFIIDVAKAQFKRDMEQRNFFDNWWKTNKTYEGAETAWYAGDGGKSLFDRADLKKYTPKTPAAAQGKFIYLGPEKGK
jgi:hypothetical protein